MKILFTICGRAGSKGIKNKNIRNFIDKPLPFYTLSAIDLFLNRHKEIQADIVVNTDSEQLIQLFQMNRIRTTDIIKRRAELALDNTPKIAVILNCLEEIEKTKKYQYDMVVDLDITSPLRKIADIENLVKKMLQTSCDVVYSVTDSRRNPYFNMVKRGQRGYERVISSNYNSRQEAPEIYDMNASLYAYSPDFLRSGISLFNGYAEAIHMYDTGILDLDHENDFELMEVIARYLFETNQEFGEIRNHIG